MYENVCTYVHMLLSNLCMSLYYIFKFTLHMYYYTVGIPAMVPGVTIDNSTVYVNGSNVTLTLSWGEPFNNLDPIVNYTVLYSVDVICPPNFITTNSTTRSFTITNLTPMTNYTFSVVATNSVGSGEAGVVNINTQSSKNISLYYTYVV